MTGSHFYKKLRQAVFSLGLFFSLNMKGSSMADAIPCGTPGAPLKGNMGSGSPCFKVNQIPIKK